MDGSNINGIEILVPRSFEGILPVSPTTEYFDYEWAPVVGLKLLISPGNAVFDIGSSYGVMACLISKLTGKAGKVFSFEADSSVIERAKELVVANKFNNITFNNKFVGEKSSTSTEFFVIPGTNSVASTQNPEILEFYSNAIPTQVETLAIDDFVKEYEIIPDICKIDVEGSEYIVVKGMQQLLSTYPVDLVIETHGDEMINIGGNLAQLLDHLQKNGYGMIDLSTLMPITKEEYLDNYNHKNSIGHILLSKKLKDEKFLKEILDKAANEIIFSTGTLASTLKTIQDLIENKKEYQKTRMQLEQILNKLPNHAQTNYLYAFCLHMQRKDLKKALHHYNVALENGFEEYWVRYNRGALLADLGKRRAASYDLDLAVKLKPNEIDARSTLERVLRSSTLQM